ncbi:hypothetical protein FRC17_002837 [Serendipita sp. 399]|nr:hypothetical protein FRC17_002837 [Serendipita sp. 399]
MYEPIRGGTRGGQAEFKWSDVSADKDREHYLGHSINAPTGRWQKNKDVHWYARDKKQSEDEKAAELAKIREAEREAMSVALGFGPSKTSTDATGGETSATTSSGANAVPLGGGAATVAPSSLAAQALDEEGDEKLSKEEKRLRKIEKKLAKIERKREKQEEMERRAMHLAGREVDHRRERDRDRDRDKDRDREHDRSSRHKDRDREREREREREYDRASRRYRDKHSRERSASPRRGDYRARRLSESGRRRSLTPLQEKPWMKDRKEQSEEYGPDEMERDRARDRMRWEENLERQEKARDSMAMRDMRY